MSGRAEKGKVEFRPAEPGARPRRPSIVEEKGETRFHRIALAGLRPHTRYAYAVTCAGERREGSFLTAAAPGQEFRFVVYGDTRTNHSEHAKIMADVVRFHPDFALEVGDLVEDGLDESQWTQFFRIEGPLLRDTPFYPVLGNHERDGAPYFRYFSVPRDYSFDYGGAHFMVLNSSAPPQERAAQDTWLRKELEKSRRAAWRIVAMHHTVYTCSAGMMRRRDAERMRARLEPILQSGNASLVLSGHAHNYQHHFVPPIHYMVSGGGGAPLLPIRMDTPYLKAAKKVHHHCEFIVRGRAMTVRAIESGGAVIDEFTIP